MAAKTKTAPEVLLGCHVSTAGGVVKAIERGETVGCTAMQVFVKQNTRWASAPLKAEDALAFREGMAKSTIKSCIAHAIYLVNCASTNPDFVRKSLDDMVDELTRCDALGISGLVMHPGAHCGAGSEKGIELIAAAINTVFDATPGGQCRILLETTAGQGTCIGHQFEDIADILSRVHNRERMGVCLDTCHVFAAGCDIRTRDGYEAMWKKFDETVGLKELKAIHLNDSKKPLASRLDRHEHIGKGQIGIEAFRMIMNDARLRGIPMVLETDKGPDMAEDIENLTLLRSLIES